MELKYRKIVAFGDSNTYGYDCRSFPDCRLPDEEIWTARLGSALGCDVINCGCNGRRMPRSRDERAVELPVITQHFPFDAVTVMLGVNDVYNFVPEEVVIDNMREFIAELKSAAPEAKIILIAPPLVRSPGNYALRQLASGYEELAGKLGVDFVSFPAGAVKAGFDGIHFSAAGHETIAELLAEHIRSM